MKKKILYIDDEIINLELFAINFRREYEVITSINPHDALNIASQEDFPVIVIDYKMPEMNGIQFITELKKEKPQSICIMLSGYLEREITTEKDVVFKHIMKPYKKEELRSVIDEAFSILS